MTTQAAILCAIYLRISLDHTGEGLAVERQREDCERIARDRGWVVFETYVDNSVSAYKRSTRRPAYERMRRDYDDGKFVAVVCWDLDRLTRQPRQLEDWIDAAEEQGLLLVTANGEADLTTHNGRMFARIKATVARGEMEQKSVRQKRAAAQRVDRGVIPAGTRLTGYTTGGKLVEQEAALVRRIFHDFEHGETLKGLARRLNAEGVTTRAGRPWNMSTLRDMLRNPRYAGLAVFKGEETGKRGAWPAVVTDTTFALVRARLDDPRRKHNREGTERKYLGSGIFRCGVCGRAVQTNGARYWCREGGHVTRSQPKVDECVVSELVWRLGVRDWIYALAPTEDERLTSLRETSSTLRQRLTQIDDDYDEGIIDGRRYAAASGKVRAELTAAEAQHAQLLTGVTVGAIMAGPDPAALFAAASLAVRRNVLDALVTVELMPAPRGRKTFDPASVVITWRTTRSIIANNKPAEIGVVPPDVVKVLLPAGS